MNALSRLNNYPQETKELSESDIDIPEAELITYYLDDETNIGEEQRKDRIQNKERNLT